jgi:Lantibiotic dehydratase, C terminus./Lantibiotic dehydratase, N terminus.
MIAMQTATTLSISTAPDHLITVPDSEWAFWRCVCLRGAGFPAQGILKLAAPAELVAAANRVLESLQEAKLAQEKALRQINLALDSLRATEQWDDKKARKVLLDARRALNENKLPRLLPESLTPDLMEEFKSALQRVDEERAHFNETFSQLAGQTSDSIREIASLPAFREALTWQNRAAIRTALDPLMRKPASGGPRRSQQKQHEELIASYWQRYCVKNDTIGFFGPVGWARFVPQGDPVAAEPGTQITTARKVYWEGWAIEALGAVIASRYKIQQWIAPILLPFLRVGNTVLYHPTFGPIRVSPKQTAVLRLCDGRETAENIAKKILQTPVGRGQSESDIYAILNEMADKGIVFWKFNIPMGPHPERTLREALERIDDAKIRSHAINLLDEMDLARVRLESSAGDPEKLDLAFENLEQTFTRLTSLSATRNQGKTYAGRTLVYEDCRRDCEVLLGPELLKSIAAPLSPLLESARWFTAQVASVYKSRIAETFHEIARSTGNATVNAADLWGKTMPMFFDGANELIGPVQQEFQRRWDRILQLGDAREPVIYSSGELRGRVAEEFPLSEPGWAGARYHSPDIMIAAHSEEAIRRGEYLFVMGEMHVSKNTLDASLFVNQHPSPEDLYAAVDQDLKLKVVPLGFKTVEQGCRTTPSLVGGTSFRLEYLADSFIADRDKAIALSALLLENHNGELIARTRDGQFCMHWIDLVGGLLSLHVIECFKVIAPRPHTPRITIDRLVLKRESWRFQPADLGFAQCSVPAERFLQARIWAQKHGIPRFAFFKVPVEGKPAYVDFDSPILVDIFAKMIRRTLDAGLPDATVDVSEMLPDPTQAWLPDANGQRYTSELRIVAVDSTPFAA